MEHACVARSAHPVTMEPSGGSISAQLLLSAQEQLRCAYQASSLAPAVSPMSMFGAATPPFVTSPGEAVTGHRMPTMPSLDSSAACTMLTTPSIPTGLCEPPHPPKTSAALLYALEQHAIPRVDSEPVRAGPKRKTPSCEDFTVAEGTNESSCDDNGGSRSSRSSTADSARKRRRRRACPADVLPTPATPAPCRMVSELLLEREQLQERCGQLQSANTRLMCHLTLALQLLQRERTSAQAEANRLRQKCNALGAFLPPSVAAFARGIPAGSDLFTRKGLQRSEAQQQP